MADAPPRRALHLCVDINVWVAFLMAAQAGRTGTSAQRIVAAARDMKLADRPIQLVMSLEMADTLERVLTRVGFSAARAHDFANAAICLLYTSPSPRDS